MKALIFYVLLIFSFKSFCQSTADSLSGELADLISESKIPGLGVSIVGEKGILYSRGFGLRDIQKKARYNVHTIQSIASVSKTIIALALLKLVEEGKVDLNKDINTYLPFKVSNPHLPDSVITLLHLATHSSSIIETNAADDGSYFIIEKDAPKKVFPKGSYKFYKRHSRNENTNLGEHVKSFLTKEGENYSQDIFGKYPPGSKYAYTNIGASLAAYLVEVVSDQSFEAFTAEHIFEPLGMDSTSWKSPKSSNYANQYFHNGMRVPEYSLITFPSGDLNTSTYDISIFLLEIVRGYNGQGRILLPESYQNMLSNHLFLEDRDKRNGIFWNINSEGNIGHGGAEIGTTCQMIFSPSLNKAFFIMINMTVYDIDKLEQDYINLLITVSSFAKKL